MDEEDLVKKKGKKPNGSKREECEEAGELFLEVGDFTKKILQGTFDNFEYLLQEIPAEKEFVCAVNLAEINRKLGIVMWSPA